MLPLCRHFSRIHPNPLSRLHMPGSRARTEQEAAQQGHLTEQHLRWVSNSTAEHRLPGRSVPTPTASAHREPPRPEPQRPDPAMDPSGSLKAGERASGTDSRSTGAAQGFTHTSHLLSPLIHQSGLGPDTSSCCCPGGDQHPESPRGTQVAEIFPHQPLEVSSRQHWGSAPVATAGKKEQPGKQWSLGKEPVARTQDALYTPWVTPNIFRGWHTSSLHCSPSLQACRSAGPSSLIGND